MANLNRDMFTEEQWKAIQEYRQQEESMDYPGHPEKASAFTKSNFARVPGDYYPTIDKRCTQALVEKFFFKLNVSFVDPCAPNGSGIIDALKEFGFKSSVCHGEVFDDRSYKNEIIVTNPPYERKLIGPIIRELIRKVSDRGAFALYILLRTGFDHGRTYADMFDSQYYAGQLKLRFRPWWSEDHAQAPIHNFVWHVWAKNVETPNIWYWPKGRKGDE